MASSSWLANRFRDLAHPHTLANAMTVLGSTDTKPHMAQLLVVMREWADIATDLEPTAKRQAALYRLALADVFRDDPSATVVGMVAVAVYLTSHASTASPSDLVTGTVMTGLGGDVTPLLLYAAALMPTPSSTRETIRILTNGPQGKLKHHAPTAKEMKRFGKTLVGSPERLQRFQAHRGELDATRLPNTRASRALTALYYNTHGRSVTDSMADLRLERKRVTPPARADVTPKPSKKKRATAVQRRASDDDATSSSDHEDEVEVEIALPWDDEDDLEVASFISQTYKRLARYQAQQRDARRTQAYRRNPFME